MPMVDCVDLDIMHTTAQEQLPVFAADLERVAADVSADGCWMMLPIKSTLSFPHLPSGRVDEGCLTVCGALAVLLRRNAVARVPATSSARARSVVR